MDALTYLRGTVDANARRSRSGRFVGLLGAVTAIAGILILFANWDQPGVNSDDLVIGAVLAIGGLLLRIEAAIFSAASRVPSVEDRVSN